MVFASHISDKGDQLKLLQINNKKLKTKPKNK